MGRRRQLALTEILVPRKRRRPLGDVADLMQSIADIGLLQPIVVTTDHRLISGRHRLEAFRRLKKEKIPVVIRDLRDLDRELAEIDENLIRNELTVLERAEHLQRRKQIYEARYPHTKQGGAPGKAGGGKQRRAKRVSSFASATAKKFKKTPRTVQTDVQIATQIPSDVRDLIRGTRAENVKRDLLRLARLPEDQQRRIAKLLASGRAEDYGNAAHIEYLGRVKKQRRAIESGKVKMPAGVFEVIVIDPPWDYGDDYRPGWSAPYATMTIEEISAIKIPAARHAVIWLWATQKHLPDAFSILKRWGFKYKATLTWHKVRGSGKRQGAGKWLRMDSEFAVMAVKGKPKVTLTTQSTVLRAQYKKHSQKPDAFYTMVDGLCVGRKLDVFARRRRPGWSAYGAEV